ARLDELVDRVLCRRDAVELNPGVDIVGNEPELIGIVLGGLAGDAKLLELVDQRVTTALDSSTSLVFRLGALERGGSHLERRPGEGVQCRLVLSTLLRADVERVPVLVDRRLYVVEGLLELAIGLPRAERLGAEATDRGGQIIDGESGPVRGLGHALELAGIP